MGKCDSKKVFFNTSLFTLIYPIPLNKGCVGTKCFSLTDCSITGNVTSGPFVDGNFQLDFSRATSGNTGFYSCTGVDELGSSATQVFYVEVSHEGR